MTVETMLRITPPTIAAMIAREFERWPKYFLDLVKVDKIVGAYSAKKLIAGL